MCNNDEAPFILLFQEIFYGKYNSALTETYVIYFLRNEPTFGPLEPSTFFNFFSIFFPSNISFFAFEKRISKCIQIN